VRRPDLVDMGAAVTQMSQLGCRVRRTNHEALSRLDMEHQRVYMTSWWAARLQRTHNLDKSRIRATD